MKNTKHTSLLPRLTALVLALGMLLSLAVLPAGASKPIDAEWVRWSYDWTSTTLTGSFPATDGREAYTRVYTDEPVLYEHLLYTMSKDYTLVYENTVTEGMIEYGIYSPTRVDPGIVFVISEDQTKGMVLLSDKGAEEAKALLRGEEITHYGILTDLMGDTKETTITRVDPTTLLSLPDGSTEQAQIPLRELRYAPLYVVMAYGESQWIGAIKGHVYRLGDRYAFVDVQNLPESYFADDVPELDYERNVSVTVYYLPEGMQKQFDREVRALSSVQMLYYNEADSIAEWPFSRAAIYPTVIFAGLVLPVAPIAVGLCLPHTAKNYGKRRWYALTVAGAVWMVCGAVVLVMVMLALR